MIAVAQDHALQIALPPLLEVEVVVLRILVARLPAVEGLVDDEHPEAVAGIEEITRRRIVAGADRVEAAGLQHLDAALFGAGNACRSERAVVVMHASAAKLDALAVHAQALRGIDFDLADADVQRGRVDDFPSASSTTSARYRCGSAGDQSWGFVKETARCDRTARRRGR